MRMFIDSFLAEVEDDDADRRGFRKKARRESKTGRIFYGYPRQRLGTPRLFPRDGILIKLKL